MAKQRYVITEQDYPAVLRYVQYKLRNNLSWPSDDLLERNEFKKCRDPVTLNSWCEKWLSGEQWQQLKTAARASRKRSRNTRRDKPKNITLTNNAWRMLSALAKRDRVTLSEFIESRLEKDWLKLD